MELMILRDPSGMKATLGELFIDGAFECHTLEDVVREIPGVPIERWKIPGRTAIPAGHYRISLENSPRFGPDTITINGVPGFTYVRMHAGNDEEDTDGCVLVGQRFEDEHRITGGTSGPALAALKQKIKEFFAREPGGDCWLRVLTA